MAHAIFAPLADAGINVDMIVQNVGHGATTDLSFTVARSDLARAKRILEPIARELGAREMTTDSAVAKVSIVGAGIHNAPGYAARMFGALADAGVNIEMISTSEIRITCIIAEDDVETAVARLHAAFELEKPDAVDTVAVAGLVGARGLIGHVAEAPFLSRRASVSRASAPRTMSSRAGWPPARPRSAWPAPTSRPPGAAATAGPGPLRRGPGCSRRSGSGRPGSRPVGPGSWRRWWRWRWPTPPRRRPGCPSARSG